MIPPLHRHCLLALLCMLCLNATSQKVSIGPVPAWVTMHSYDKVDDFGRHDAEDGYLDLAFEKQVLAAPYSTYIKKVMKVLTETGIENISKVSVNYDPTYEQLVFHTIRIIRDGKSINRLDRSKIKTIQREEEIDKNLYDGSLTAIIILDDLRKGDLLEFSYTIKGSNPVFDGKLSESFSLNFSVPIGNLYYKVIGPSDRAFYIKNFNSPLQPSIKKDKNENTYEWALTHVPAFRRQDNLPGWYSPYATVMLSEYKDWKDVNDWALKLFPEQQNLSAPLRKKIEEIRVSNKTIEEQVGASLEFVQDQIRYMGIEVGANSHQPAHPDKIFAQRYGDCKDKSYLLCTMLKALGVEASPVLINTYAKKDLENWTACADAFNHVTVKAIVNGRAHWFDPTISYQRGNIDMISYPDYQVGLVIAPGTTGLTKIENKEPGSVDVKEVFDINDKTGSAVLKVTTRYTGSFADDVRSEFHEASHYEILKNYREYYSSFHQDIKGDSVTTEEEARSGAFIVKEYYTIEKIWELTDGEMKAIFSPYIILGVLKKPADTRRKMPFAIRYPAKYHEQVIINTPQNLNMSESKDFVSIDPFKIKLNFEHKYGSVILTYDYEAHQDYVSTEDAQEYLNAIEKIDNRFSFHLPEGKNNDQVSKLNYNTAKGQNATRSTIISLISLLLIGGGVWLFIRRRP